MFATQMLVANRGGGWELGMDGTPSGLQTVFLAQRPLLLRMLVARLQSAEDAEDVLQDLWLKLDQMSDRPIHAPVPLLFRAAANLATDRRIAAARRSARDSAWADHQPAPDDLPSVERSMIAREDWAAMNSAIERMPPRMAAALRMYRLEGVGQRDIAERLGVSLSAVEKLLRKAYIQILKRSPHDGAEIGSSRRLNVKGEKDRDE